jgi:hypothetical protein
MPATRTPSKPSASKGGGNKRSRSRAAKRPEQPAAKPEQQPAPEPAQSAAPAKRNGRAKREPSKRDKEALALYEQGVSTSQIAERLNLPLENPAWTPTTNARVAIRRAHGSGKLPARQPSEQDKRALALYLKGAKLAAITETLKLPKAYPSALPSTTARLAVKRANGGEMPKAPAKPAPAKK